MPDFRSEQFERSLADTVAWCNMKAIGMDADADDIRQRHAPCAQAKELWEEAQETAKRCWLGQKITGTKHWQNAMALLKQIRNSLGPMDRKLRSPELQPSFRLDGFGDDPLWKLTYNPLSLDPELTIRKSRTVFVFFSQLASP